MRPRLCLLLTPFLLISCDARTGPTGETKPTAVASTLDACDLFPNDEATAIAGSYVSGMSSTLEDAQGRDPLSCAYNAGSTEQPSLLSLVVRVHPSPERAASTLLAARGSLERMTRGDLRDIPNLGDGAFWAGGGLKQLHVRKGEKQILITCQLSEPAAALAGAEKIARAALARLARL